ncbi:MAG: TetR family transcriptional regulator [Azospirillum brasilense]|nr:MAG: TetR family transcriptional regulator [Azospirillum brasilense]
MGRHREFDVDQALDAALMVFWIKGYEGASYDDLSEATGVARPGLYSAFGNKEAFFQKAVDRYEAKFTGYFGEALEEPRVRDVVRCILEGAVKAQTSSPGPRGCMIINGAMSCSDESKSVREELIRRRDAAEAALLERFEQARRGGDLPQSANCATLACYVMTVTHGIAVQGKAGASKVILDAMVAQVLDSWPPAPSAPARTMSAGRGR